MADNPFNITPDFDEIVTEIALSIQSAGQAIQELSKEKPSQNIAETHTQQFWKLLSNVDTKLSELLDYLSQESIEPNLNGSGYDLAERLRIQHVLSRVLELEQIKEKYTHAAHQEQQQDAQQATATVAKSTGGAGDNQDQGSVNQSDL